jgi:multicomponent Na+:H+ antiporter subunit E
MKRVGRLISFFELSGYFVIQLVLANIQVALLLFKPNRLLKPAIVAVPLGEISDFALYCLSSMITLTPGTLSLEVSQDRKKLFVHVIHTDSPAETVRDIRNGFLARVLWVYDGQKLPRGAHANLD